MSKERSIEQLPLDGGVLCLDFINTVHSRTDKEIYEYLSDYSNFISWCRKVNILNREQAETLEQFNASHPHKSLATLKEVKESSRNYVYIIFGHCGRESVKYFLKMCFHTLTKNCR